MRNRHCFLALASFAAIFTSCGSGSKRVEDFKNAEVGPIIIQDRVRYQRVHNLDDNTVGVADTLGNIIVPVKYAQFQLLAHQSDPGLDRVIVMTPDQKMGLVDIKGDNIIKPKFESLSYRRVMAPSDSIDGFVASNSSDGFVTGYYDSDGNCLVPFEVVSFSYEGNGNFVVKKRDRKEESSRDYVGLYANGKEVIPVEYRTLRVSGSGNGALATTWDDKSTSWSSKEYVVFNLADGVNKTIFHGRIPRLTDHYAVYEEKVDGAYREGLRDFDAQIVFPAGEFSQMNESDGYILGSTASNRGYSVLFDKDRNRVFDNKYVSLSPVKGTDLFIAYTDFGEHSYVNKYGVINGKGVWVVPQDYAHIEIFPGKIHAYPTYSTYRPESHAFVEIPY